MNTANGPLEIKGALRRTLLAALLLRPNEVVSADQLAQLLWGDRPRVSATTSLYNQVMRLRQALGPLAGRIRAVPPGYVIDVEPGELDTEVFTEYCAAAARAGRHGDWEACAREYAAALALWHGEPLADVPALQSAAALQQLTEERILAVQGRIKADLHLGRHDQVIGELRTLIQHHPWREAFHGQLMLALYRAGRQSEALDVYRDLRREIAAEFGVEPGENVRKLHAGILRSDPSLALPAAARSPVPHSMERAAAPARVALTDGLRDKPPIRQLPADTRAFTGREAELDSLIRAARAAGHDAAGQTANATPTVVVSAINGMGGIGKTALAVRAAHRLAEHYPDGQLFIDLHGHSADLEPISPRDALDYLLRSIGLEPAAIPADTQERAALYRSRLAGTKTLIVFDNARTPAQIKPLIPADPGCLVLVTSRNQLAGLDDAEFLGLDALAPDEAIGLLGNAAGPGRVDPCDPAARELTEWCGRLPLAIRILGARLRHRPKLTPQALLAAIRADSDPLALLKDDDRDITAVFASSLDVLPEPERRLFARLGLVPGPDFDAHAAASVLDTDPAETERLLENLLGHSLLIQHEEGRYRLHDLLRAYARVRAAERDERENQQALERLLDYYVTTARWARTLWLDKPGEAKPPTSAVSRVTCAADAESWLRAELDNLIAVFDHNALDPESKCALATDLARYLKIAGPWDRLISLHRSHIEVARSLNRSDEEAEILLALGNTYYDRGMVADAIESMSHALAISRRTGNRLGEARALRGLGWAHGSGETARALRYAQQSLEILRGLGDKAAEMETTNIFALIANQNARFEETVAICEHALTVAGQNRDARSETNALFHLSHAYYALERFDEIEPALTRALATGDPGYPGRYAAVRQELGRYRILRGRYDEAAAYIEDALESFIEYGFTTGIGYAHGELGRIRLWLGDQDGAMHLLGRGLRVAIDTGNRYVEAFVRVNIAYVHIAREEFAAAQEQLRASLEASLRGGFMLCQVEARVALCALSLARDGAAAALRQHRDTLEFGRRVRHPREVAAVLVGLGRCELATGDREAGVAHLHEAIDLYQRMGSEIDVAKTRAHLPADA